MLQYLRSSEADQTITPRDALRVGSWLRCEKPSSEEIDTLLVLGMDENIIKDALDPHEVSLRMSGRI